jgi:hypothetical protein
MSVLGQAAGRRVAAMLALAPALAAVGIAPSAAMNRPVKIEITSMTAQRSAPDQPLLVVHVSNKGRRATDLSGELRLTNGPSGGTEGPFGAQPVNLAPGQQADVDFALTATLPSGPWLATVTLTSGLYSATATSTVTFADPRSWSWVTVAGMVTGASIVIALIIVGLSLVYRWTLP